MHPNEALARRLYDAFARRDGAAMAACYSPDARFGDPVFPDLRGEAIGAMWTMLTSQGKDLRVEYEVVRADDAGAVVRWQAWYTFSATKRAVHNIIEATLAMRDGAIVTHDDAFDLGRWARMALGPVGWLFPILPPLRAKLRKRAADNLARFRASAASRG